MNSEPLVSVITIFLNEEKFIEEAIKSVFAQTYEKWELLLVDDGSSDASTGIARHYGEQYPGKVRYLEHIAHQNRGKSASRNLGVHHARGKYIVFLDANDVWLSRKLEQQVLILDAQPEAGMVYGASQYWYSWTGNPEAIQRDFTPNLGVPPNTLVRPPRLLIPVLRNETKLFAASSVLVRREVIKRIGGFEEAFRGMYEDQSFFAKVCLKVPVFVTGECFTKIRQHPNNRSSLASKTGQWHAAEQTYLNWLAEYVSDQTVQDGKEWVVLQKLLWPYRHPILHRASKCAWHCLRQMHTKIMISAGDERRYAKLLNRKVVKSVVAEKYGLRVTDIEPFSGGTENGAWLVMSDQGVWVAKAYAFSAEPFERIQEEVDLYSYLLAHDITVPAVRTSLQGHQVEELVSGGYTYPLVVMRYEKLYFTTPSKITQAEMETIGKEIARVHTILQRYPQPHLLNPGGGRTNGPSSTTEYHGEYSHFAASYNGKFYTPSELQAIEQIDRQIVQYLNSYKISENLQMSVIHRDLQLCHTPFLPNGRVYFFDWDQRWGPVARDLAILCVGLYRSEDISFSRWEELKGWLLFGYSSIMPLTRDDLQAMQTLTLRRLLGEVFHVCSLSTQLKRKFGVGQVKRNYQLASYLLEKS